MTRSDNALFEPRIADWLEDGPNAAPEDALSVVLADLPSVNQRHTWTSPTMLAAVATAAVVAVVVVGLAVAITIGLPQPGVVPDGSVSPSPTQPIPTPSPSQSSPAPSASSAPATGTTQELVGPWQAEPIPLDAALVSELDAQCVALEFMTPGQSLAVVDARGEGRVILQYAGGGHDATCEGTVHPDGSTSARNIQSSVGEPGQVVPLAATELLGGFSFGSPFDAGTEDDQWRAQTGQAGLGISQVVVEVPGLASPVVASLNNGWYTLWWPIQAPGGWRVIGLDADGQEVATLDLPQ
jgi:hypothetical protein